MESVNNRLYTSVRTCVLTTMLLIQYKYNSIAVLKTRLQFFYKNKYKQYTCIGQNVSYLSTDLSIALVQFILLTFKPLSTQKYFINIIQGLSTKTVTKGLWQKT